MRNINSYIDSNFPKNNIIYSDGLNDYSSYYNSTDPSCEVDKFKYVQFENAMHNNYHYRRLFQDGLFYGKIEHIDNDTLDKLTCNEIVCVTKDGFIIDDPSLSLFGYETELGYYERFLLHVLVMFEDSGFDIPSDVEVNPNDLKVSCSEKINSLFDSDIKGIRVMRSKLIIYGKNGSYKVIDNLDFLVSYLASWKTDICSITLDTISMLLSPESFSVVDFLQSEYSVDLSGYSEILPSDLNKDKWSEDQTNALRVYEGIGDKFLDLYSYTVLSPQFETVKDLRDYTSDLVSNRNLAVMFVKTGLSAFFVSSKKSNICGDFADMFEAIVGMVAETYEYDVLKCNNFIRSLGYFVFVSSIDDYQNHPVLNLIETVVSADTRVYLSKFDTLVIRSEGISVSSRVKLEPIQVLNGISFNLDSNQNTLYKVKQRIKCVTYSKFDHENVISESDIFVNGDYNRIIRWASNNSSLSRGDVSNLNYRNSHNGLKNLSFSTVDNSVDKVVKFKNNNYSSGKSYNSVIQGFSNVVSKFNKDYSFRMDNCDNYLSDFQQKSDFNDNGAERYKRVIFNDNLPANSFRIMVLYELFQKGLIQDLNFSTIQRGDGRNGVSPKWNVRCTFSFVDEIYCAEVCDCPNKKIGKSVLGEFIYLEFPEVFNTYS